MKIVLVNFSLDAESGGGTAERTRHLANYLSQAGNQCQLITINGNSWQSEFDANQIKTWITGSIGKRFPVPLLNPWRTYKIIKQADIIYITGYWNLLTASISLVARILKKPYVLSPAGEFISIANPRPVMRVYHQLIGQPVIHGAAGFIAITQLEQTLIQQHTHVDLERIAIIPNAVEVKNISNKVTNLPDSPFILFMGRLATIKGPDLLLEAYLKTPLLHEYHLVFAGPDFGMQAELELQIREFGLLNKIHFIGFLNERERTFVYHQAMLLAIPSRSEAMSLVALEAGAVGLPVLLTDTCGFDEVAKVGGGVIVKPNANSIAEGLLQMLADKNNLQEMGLNLKELIQEKYSWESVVETLLEQLNFIINKN